MPISTPRSRIINFRLTEDEYTALRSHCAAQGSRCLSDYARAAVLSGSRPGDPTLESLQARLSSLDQRLALLGEQVYRVLELLESEPVGAR